MIDGKAAPLRDALVTGKGTAIGFQVGGRYDVSPELSVGLRVPLTTATVKQSNGKQPEPAPCSARPSCSASTACRSAA